MLQHGAQLTCTDIQRHSTQKVTFEVQEKCWKSAVEFWKYSFGFELCFRILTPFNQNKRTAVFPMPVCSWLRAGK